MLTSLPPVLPPEMFDHIVDHLWDKPVALKACCTVSKSWVSRARRHLFFRVEFYSEVCVKLWEKAFPDPSCSPAQFTRVLLLLHGVTAAASTHLFPWVASFCRLVELQVTNQSDHPRVSLVPFYGLSSFLKSLSLEDSLTPLQEVLNLICSFPLLENLRLHCHFNADDAVTAEWNAPSHSPKLTGSLHLTGRIRSFACMLLRLPNGIHFSKVAITCDAQDAGWASDLMLGCSDTLESFCIGYHGLRAFPSVSAVVQNLTTTHRPKHIQGATSN